MKFRSETGGFVGQSGEGEEPAPVYMEERKQRILELLAERHKISVNALSEELGVSTATIRTYLRDLEAGGLLTRTHGGAMEKTRTGFEALTRDKERQNVDLKRQIAEKASACVESGDVILLDTGTTCHALARLLKDGRSLTVVTNDIIIAAELEPAESVQVILIGGIVRRGLHCTVGAQEKRLCDGLVVDKAFMGANGFSLEHGATTPDIHQAATKKRMMAMAQKVYLLCDHTKLDRPSFAVFAAIEDIDVFICDSEISNDDRKALEERGMELC